MTTVLRIEGFQLRVHPPPREHGPPHVHVVKDDGEVLIELDPVEIRELRGTVTNAHMAKALQLVQEHVETLRTEWSRLHGR